MKPSYLMLVALTAALSTACASRQAATDESKSKSAAQTTAAKDGAQKEAAPEGEVVGKPAAGSKFAKLKIGMALAQVEKLIGKPANQWQHPTGKSAIPFYFGPDRWVIQYSYKGEGVLTFNYGGEQVLTRIVVNKAE